MFRILKTSLYLFLGFLIGSSSCGLRIKDAYYKYLKKPQVAEGFYPHPFSLERRFVINSHGKLEVYIVDRDTGWRRKIGPYGITNQSLENIKQSPKSDRVKVFKGKQAAPEFVDNPLDLSLEVDLDDQGRLETFLINPTTNEKLPVRQVDGKTQVGGFEHQVSGWIAKIRIKSSNWRATFGDFFHRVENMFFGPDVKQDMTKDKSK